MSGGGRSRLREAPRGGLTVVGTGALVGVFAGALAAGVEIAVVLSGTHELFVSAAERTRFVWTLGVMLSCAGGVAGVAAVPCVLVVSRLTRRFGGGPRALGRVVATMALPLLVWTAILAVSGSGARRIPGRLVLAALAAFAGTALVGLGVRWLAPALAAASRRQRLAAAFALAALAVALGLADRHVLPRLYGWFHLWLGLGGVGCFAGALLLVAEPLGRWPRSVAVVGAFVLAGAWLGGVLGLTTVLRTENLRFVLAEEAPHGGRLLEAAVALGIRPIVPRGSADGLALGARTGRGTLPVLDVASTDVFLITIDAVRADHVGTYGYERTTTPRIDAFAQGAVVFEHAYTPTPHTSYAMTSLFTGKYVRSLVRLGVELHDQETLADVLRSRGYRTAAFYPRAVFFIDRERFETLADRHLGFQYVKVGPAPAPRRTRQVLEYLDRRRDPDRPLFAWVHYFDPHEPYRPPEDALDFGHEAVDRYDGEIWTVDRALVPLLDRIDRDFPDALVLLTSDHGEEFGEHGGRYHGTTTYEEQARVPLIIRGPGLSPRRVPDVVEIVDVFGTVLALLDLPPSPRLRSTDLRPLLVGEHDPDARAFIETEDSLAVVSEQGKLVCRTDAAACRLFDLSRDPGEQAGRAPTGAHAAALRRALSAWAVSHARWEERPPEAAGGRWPEALRRALLGDATAAREVVPLLGNDSVQVRRRAAAVLGDLGAEETRDALVRSLEDEDAEVRELAALSLGRLGDPRALAALERGLVHEGADGEAELRTRRRAALGLGALGDARSVPALVELLRDESWPLEDRRRAVESLATMGDGRSVPGLVAALPVLRTRSAVIEALGRIGDRRAVPPLLGLLETDRYAHHKAAAVRGLGTLGDRRALPAILAAGRLDDPPPDVVWALLELGAAAGIEGGEAVDLALSPPAGWRCDDAGCGVGVSGIPLREEVSGAAARVLVRAHAEADGGRLSVLLGGRASNQRPLVRGWQELHFDLPAHAADAGPGQALHLRVDPPETDVRARAVVVLRRTPRASP